MEELYQTLKDNISQLCEFNNEKEWIKLYDATAKRIQKLTDVHPAMAQIMVDQLISIRKYCFNHNTFWKNGKLYRIQKSFRNQTYKIEDDVLHIGKQVYF